MNGNDALSLHFQCTLETPFHSTEKVYKNLLKCSPYILGSTLRGSMLGHIITQVCPKEKLADLASLRGQKQILEYHSSCEFDCFIKALIYRNDWAVVVSFGTFEKPDYISTTRIALTRDKRAQCEGRIFNLENIRAGCSFSFEVILTNKVSVEQVSKAFEEIGQYFGLGHYKNVGMGRFKIDDIYEKALGESLNETMESLRSTNGNVTLEFKTPFVLNYGDSLIDISSKEFGLLFSQMLLDRSRALSDRFGLKLTLEPVPFTSANAQIVPDYISRYSFEESTKINRLIARAPGSCLNLTLDSSSATLRTQLALCSLFGIGEWSDVGFGRFDIRS